MKLQYILTIIMIGAVLGGCQGSNDTRQELEREMFTNCMRVSDAAIPDSSTNPKEWTEIIKACRVIAQDTFKGYEPKLKTDKITNSGGRKVRSHD